MSQSGKTSLMMKTMCMRDMMEQQNLFYEEMLSRQEANFMSFKKMILESTTSGNDGIIKEEEEGISLCVLRTCQTFFLFKKRLGYL